MFTPLLLGTPALHFVASNQLPLAAPVQLVLTCAAWAGWANGSAARAAGSRAIVVRRANRARTACARTLSAERPVMSSLRRVWGRACRLEQLIRRRQSPRGCSIYNRALPRVPVP